MRLLAHYCGSDKREARSARPFVACQTAFLLRLLIPPLVLPLKVPLVSLTGYCCGLYLRALSGKMF